MQTFTVSIRVKAIVSIPIIAESLETALKLGQEKITKKTVFELDGVEVLDGNEEIVGVDAGWNLE